LLLPLFLDDGGLDERRPRAEQRVPLLDELLAARLPVVGVLHVAPVGELEHGAEAAEIVLVFGQRREERAQLLPELGFAGLGENEGKSEKGETHGDSLSVRISAPRLSYIRWRPGVSSLGVEGF